MTFKDIIDRVILKDTEERNPDGLTFDEFVSKYPGMKRIAYACWYLGCYPEELKKELATLMQEGT